MTEQSASNTFAHVRQAALKRWFDATKRHREDSEDDFSEAFECNWQKRMQEKCHVSLFCGIGEWACHISDILLDESNDQLEFSNPKTERRLSRHYFRLMFIVAELLSDFEVALGKIFKNENTKVGSLRNLLGEDEDVENFQAYVNSVVKHKAGRLHHIDHHLPIHFEDSSQTPPSNSIKLGSRFDINNGYSHISVPSLNKILDIVLTAYVKFDTIIADEDKYNKVCEGYTRCDENEKVDN